MRHGNRKTGWMARGFSLIEAVAVVVIIAVAAPPASMMLTEAARARRDSVSNPRAQWLATATLEHVLADSRSAADGRGFEAFGDATLYLEEANDGLYARLDDMLSFYESAGLTVEVEIGGLISHDGTVTGDADRDVFREVAAIVRWRKSDGEMAETRIGSLVTDL
ncbi:MAG: prepilin-type N-terminal cleavage/methylation domain-containing protein [Planctomycetota bacterium]|nr:prepilin-type N-terminal cleavage/methylation domain-containing protein [Planctomycetota bacterium]